MVKQGVLAVNPWEDASGLDPEAVHKFRCFVVDSHSLPAIITICHDYPVYYSWPVNSLHVHGFTQLLIEA